MSQRMRKRELREQLPPGPAIPASLQLLATWKRPAASLERLRSRYGPRITVQLPFQPPFVILSDPEEIKELFTAPADAIHPGEGAGILEPIVGRNSVILLDEDLHMEQRKLLLPAFHGEKMKAMAGLMAELAEREVESWPAEQPATLHPRLQRLTLEIILRAVFGLGQGRRLDDLRELLTEVLSFSESPLSVLPAARRFASRLPQFRRFDRMIARTDEIVAALIAERRAEAQDGQETRDGVLAMLLSACHEDDSPMSDQEIRDELMTALVAGHETTASQLAWALERLAREPDVVARLQDELQHGNGDDYLIATIHETLRLRPVLPNAEPRLTKRQIRIGGHEYPAGVALLASVFLVHHDPVLYPEPWVFRPERFLNQQPGTYTWIPFGGGRRRCIGASFAIQEMKVVLRAVIERYELLPAGSRPESTGRRSITFSPERGATIVLRRRAAHPARPQAALPAHA